MLKNRVLAGWIFSFTIGAGIGIYSDGKIRVAAFALIGVLCGLMFAAHRFFAPELKNVIFVGLIMLCGMTYSAAYTVYAFSGSEVYMNRSDSVAGRVSDIGVFSDGGYLDINLSESSLGLGKGTMIRLYYTEIPIDNKTGKNIGIKRGDIVNCSLIYKTNQSSRLYSGGIYITAQGSIDSSTSGSGFLYRLRESAEESTGRLFKAFPSEVSGVAKTLITGDSSHTDTYTYSLFRNAGVAHLLVISGLHVSVIVMSLFAFLELLTVRKQLRSIICIFVLLVYALYVGFTPSVSRAVIMTGIMLLIMLVTRRADSITSLFIALFVLMLINPYILFSVGMGLSFLSCFGILVLSPHLSRPISGSAARAKRIIRVLLSPLLFSVAATVFSFPVLLIGFDSVSYIAPLVNLVVTPLFFWFLIILVPSVALYSVVGAGSQFFSFLPANSITLLHRFLQWLFERDIGSFSTHIPYMVIPAAFALSITGAICVLRQRKMYIATGALLVCFILSLTVCLVSWDNNKRDSTVVAVNDSFAYKSLFTANGKECLYIDLGGVKSGISAVYKHGYSTLDSYVLSGLTEADVKRFESAAAVINISAVYIPKVTISDVEQYSIIKRLANSRGCVIIEYDHTVLWTIGRASVSVFYSGEGKLADGFIASIASSGKSISVYGGQRLDNYSYGYSDAVIMLGKYARPYDDIYCLYRCVRQSGYYYPPESRSTETLIDYDYNEYTRVTIKNKVIEVSINEP